MREREEGELAAERRPGTPEAPGLDSLRRGRPPDPGDVPRVLRGARAPARALVEPDPPARVRAPAHERRDEPVHPVLPRQGRTRRSGARRPCQKCFRDQRHRQRRAHRPTPHLLRDARQLLLRRLLQGRVVRLGPRARHAGVRDRPPAAVGDGLRDRRGDRRDLAGPRDPRAPGSSAAARPTTTGRPTPRAPAGPCSEIYVDRGPRYGPEGGPAVDEDRFLEIWNHVFMQDLVDEHGEVVGELPAKNIDTGASVERIARGAPGRPDGLRDRPVPSAPRGGGVALRPPATARTTGGDVSSGSSPSTARATTFLIADGVQPSNEGRGYVLRRMLRRLVVATPGGSGSSGRSWHRLVARRRWSPFGDAYPELVENRAFVEQVDAPEEERFARDAPPGDGPVRGGGGPARARGRLPGDVVFKLHDTFGFPPELTRELAGDAGLAVDGSGSSALMAEQRERAQRGRQARRWGRTSAPCPVGRTEFVGYETLEAEARIGRRSTRGRPRSRSPRRARRSAVVLGPDPVLRGGRRPGRGPGRDPYLRRGAACGSTTPSGPGPHDRPPGHGREPARCAGRGRPRRGGPRAAGGDRAGPHRDPRRPLDPPPRARRARPAGGLARGAGAAAVRLPPPTRPCRATPRARRGARRTAAWPRTSRSRSSRRPSTRPGARARSRSSARSTATSCASSRSGTTRGSCAGGPTCRTPATGRGRAVPRGRRSAPGCAGSRRSVGPDALRRSTLERELLRGLVRGPGRRRPPGGPGAGAAAVVQVQAPAAASSAGSAARTREAGSPPWRSPRSPWRRGAGGLGGSPGGRGPGGPRPGAGAARPRRLAARAAASCSAAPRAARRLVAAACSKNLVARGVTAPAPARARGQGDRRGRRRQADPRVRGRAAGPAAVRDALGADPRSPPRSSSGLRSCGARAAGPAGGSSASTSGRPGSASRSPTTNAAGSPCPSAPIADGSAPGPPPPSPSSSAERGVVAGGRGAPALALGASAGEAARQAEAFAEALREVLPSPWPSTTSA
ncbi:MAG: hypothetical protein KatS3mg013_0330 [Actinomycetota bacterium]|nr:MAG: hypothetical protein KatS3mg013_0330 [Actinomycetota bacterium]